MRDPLFERSAFTPGYHPAEVADFAAGSCPGLLRGPSGPTKSS